MTNTTTLNTYRKRERERILHTHEDITSRQKNKSMNVQIKAEPNKVKNVQLLLPEKQLVTVRRGKPTQATATATTHRSFGQHSHKGARVSREAVSQVVQRGSHNILAVGRGVRLRVAAPA